MTEAERELLLQISDAFLRQVGDRLTTDEQSELWQLVQNVEDEQWDGEQHDG